MADDQNPQVVIDDLRLMLKESQALLNKSASYGKELITTIEELNLKIQQNNNTIDTLMQENHNLKMENSCCKDDNNFLRGELDTLTEEIKARQQKEESESDKAFAVHKVECEEYEKKMEYLIAEVSIKNEIIDELERRNSSKCQEESDFSTKVAHLEQVVLDLQEMSNKAIIQKKYYEEELKVKEQLLDECKENFHAEQEKMKFFVNQLEEKDLQTEALCESLKFARDEITDLQSDLQLSRSTTNEVDPNKRGNSLFGEVDDRRLKMEALVIKLKNKCIELRSENEEQKKSIQILQMKISSLHLAAKSKVSKKIVEQLERELTEAQNDIILLMNKEADRFKTCPSPPNPQLISSGEANTDTEYRCLRMMIRQSQSHLEERESEIREMWSERVAAREERKEYRRKIISLEQEMNHLKAENIRAALEKMAKSEGKENNSDETESVSDETCPDEYIGSVTSTTTDTKVRKVASTSENMIQPKRVVNECKQQ